MSDDAKAERENIARFVRHRAVWMLTFAEVAFYEGDQERADFLASKHHFYAQMAEDIRTGRYLEVDTSWVK